MKHKTAGITGIATLALAAAGIAGVAQAASSGPSPQAGGEARHSAARATNGLTTCVGGAQKATYTRINSVPRTFGEGAAVQVGGTPFVVSGPIAGTDVLDIAFSAETQLRNSSATDYFDWMELEVRVDGVPVQPFGSAADPLALTGSREYSSNATQFCTRVGPGRHTIRVLTKLVDNGTDDSLLGWIDDTTLHVERSE